MREKFQSLYRQLIFRCKESKNRIYSMLFLKGLPVKNNFEPLGAIVGQKPHATALAFLEKNLFTRPKTAFPSCKTTLKRKIFAARIVGNVGYPPNPTTTQGL